MPSTSANRVPESSVPQPCTITDFLNLFAGKETHSYAEFVARIDAVEGKLGKSEVMNDLITWNIDVSKLYLWENHPSIYSLLGSERFGSLPHEKSSICEAIHRAEALISLTGFTFRDNMVSYLKGLGPASGRGLFDSDGQPIGFTLADFCLHRTKLIPLHKLVQSGKAPLEPVWEKFFDSSFLEFKAYCFSKITDKPKGSFAARSSSSKGANRPGRVAEERDENSFEPPDPFRGNTRPSPSEEGTGSKPPVEHHVILPLPEFSKGKLPSGTCPRLSWLFPARRGILSGTDDDATSVDDKLSTKAD